MLLKQVILIVLVISDGNGLATLDTGRSFNETLSTTSSMALKSDLKNIEILRIGVTLPFSSSDASLPAAAIVGIQEVQRRGLLPGYHISHKFGNTACDSRVGMKVAVGMWASEGSIDAIIGETCSSVCLPVGLLTAAWNLPLVSHRCQADTLSDKTVYPTFTRVVGVYDGYLGCVLGLLKAFHWDRLAIVSGTVALFKNFADTVKNAAESVLVSFYTVEDTLAGSKALPDRLALQKQVIRDIKTKARVVLILLYTAEVRNFMVSAYEENMLNGEYAFFGLGHAYTLDKDTFYRPELSETFLRHGMLAIAIDDPEGTAWSNFQTAVKKVLNLGLLDNVPNLDLHRPLAIDAYTGFPPSSDTAYTLMLTTKNPPAEVDPRGLMHDAVLQWAYGVNKTLGQGHSARDGLRITSNILGSVIEGITGPIVIDKQGNRLVNAKIIMWQHGEAVKVMRWNAVTSSLEKLYKPEDSGDWSGLSWPGNNSHPITGVPACGWDDQSCDKQSKNTPAYFVLVVVPICFILIIFGILLRQRKRRSMIKSCIVDWTAIRFDERKGSVLSMSGNASKTPVAFFEDQLVVVQPLGEANLSATSPHVQKELAAISQVRHENLNLFIGLCLDSPNNAILMLYAARGSLYDVIHQEMVLSADIKQSLIVDMAQGMKYLHSTDIQVHGHLTSHNCVIDHRWICKITDYGLNTVRKMCSVGQPEPAAEKLLWTAPELLMSPANMTPAVDLYSFGVIAQEVFTQDEPYASRWDAEEIITKIKSGDTSVRPVLPFAFAKANIIAMIERCISWIPVERPTFSDVVRVLKTANKEHSGSLVDRMVRRLEQHTRNLEITVAERALALNEEKLKLEYLLSELLPAMIADNLKQGKLIEPESFDEVTLFFSDIVSFTHISAAGTPMDVVRMLNLMYTMFDAVSSHYDVYKVATIGDAYFVASGVPVKNGDQHAREIADMALELVASSSSFLIPHLPGQTLKVRVGIHSGYCVAGVVGIKTPRYLLFGDTVETTSRMEASGQAMKIHVSEKAAQLLTQHKHLRLTKRTDFIFNDLYSTYWLDRANV